MKKRCLSRMQKTSISLQKRSVPDSEVLTIRFDILSGESIALEHLEMKPRADKITDPPCPSFFPRGRSQERCLQSGQKIGLVWMQQRSKLGGGIIADVMGMGKVCSHHAHETLHGHWVNPWPWRPNFTTWTDSGTRHARRLHFLRWKRLSTRPKTQLWLSL